MMFIWLDAKATKQIKFKTIEYMQILVLMKFNFSPSNIINRLHKNMEKSRPLWYKCQTRVVIHNKLITICYDQSMDILNFKSQLNFIKYLKTKLNWRINNLRTKTKLRRYTCIFYPTSFKFSLINDIAKCHKIVTCINFICA